MPQTARGTAPPRSARRRKAAMVVALLGGMGLQPALAGETCIRFYNENPSIPAYHVSFDLDNALAVCPTGTCWQADVRLGEMKEYCPGPLVYPPVFANGFKLVFSRDGNYWGERHGSLSRDRTTLCHITVTADGHPLFRDCEKLHIY